MFRWFYNLLYDSSLASFRSDFPVSESVHRLSAQVKPSTLHTLFRESAVGSVSASGVSLYRYAPLIQNPFQCIFVGTFSETETAVVLSGRFTLRMPVKLFLTVWFGCGFAFGLFAIAAIIVNRNLETILASVALLGLLGFVCIVIKFAKWYSRNDVDWLSAVIRSALSPNTT